MSGTAVKVVWLMMCWEGVGVVEICDVMKVIEVSASVVRCVSCEWGKSNWAPRLQHEAWQASRAGRQGRIFAL